MKSVPGEGSNEVDFVVEAAATLSLEENWPSDKELFKDRPCLSIADKRAILQHGPCQPSTLLNYYVSDSVNNRMDSNCEENGSAIHH